ncbi:MAG: sodium:proline symporter, partial [Gammaproteobacteria bacterium]
GLDGMASGMATVDPALLDPFTNAAGEPLGAIAVISLLGWGLGYFGQPHILARFMAASSVERIRDSRRIAMTWVTVALACGMVVGMCGIALLDEPLAGADTEKIFILMATIFLNPVVAGVCLAGILAAVMSTADSQLLVASSAVSEDLYKGFFRREASPGELLWVGRLAVVAIAMLALFLASDPDSKVLDLVAYAWAGFGAAFGPVILISLYWRGMSRSGAIAGVLTGGITVIAWKQLAGGIFDIYEIVPGVLFSAAAVFGASAFSRGGGR